MQGLPPNRMGLGMRSGPPMPSFGQGPSMSALAAQQQQMQFMQPPQAQKSATLFVGSISGGIDDAFLTRLLVTCGPIISFKRLITPANKPQGFGFAEYQDPDSALRAIDLLNGVELPALEDGCANKQLLVKPDEKTRMFLDAIRSQRMMTPQIEAATANAKTGIQKLIDEINKVSNEYAQAGRLDKDKYVIPPHLHDLQEADLPDNQRGIVLSEIAMFREKAAKREREKMRDVQTSFQRPGPGTPSGPSKMREWGKPQQGQQPPSGPKSKESFSGGRQGYDKPVDFVRAGSEKLEERIRMKTDEEMEQDRREARRRDETNSFKDRERRYEPRERRRIADIERAITRERQTKEAEERDKVEMRHRLDIWDDDESDETFYVDRTQWRKNRSRRLEAEQAADMKSRQFEEQEAENLRRESEDFLSRQMEEMNALAEEQRNAGLLLDDGAPVRLGFTAGGASKKDEKKAAGEDGKMRVFGQEEEDEEEMARRRKAPLVKLDFSVAESSNEETKKEKLEKIRESVPSDKETLFKAKVRWDGVTETLVDRKFEPVIKKLMLKYLGEEEEDLVMFVLEHLKDRKGPLKLIEGLEPVLEEEAVDLTLSVWRQVIFESMAYGEGLLTDRMLVD